MFRTTLCCAALVAGLAHRSRASPPPAACEGDGCHAREGKAPQHHAVHARAGCQHARRRGRGRAITPQRPQKRTRAPHRAIAARQKSVPMPVEAATSFASQPEPGRQVQPRNGHAIQSDRPRRRCGSGRNDGRGRSQRSRTCNWSMRRISTTSTARPTATRRPVDQIRRAVDVAQTRQRAGQRFLAAVDLVCAREHLRRARNGGASTRPPVTRVYRDRCSSSGNGW